MGRTISQKLTTDTHTLQITKCHLHRHPITTHHNPTLPQTVVMAATAILPHSIPAKQVNIAMATLSALEITLLLTLTLPTFSSSRSSIILKSSNNTLLKMDFFLCPFMVRFITILTLTNLTLTNLTISPFLSPTKLTIATHSATGLQLLRILSYIISQHSNPSVSVSAPRTQS